jgi:hypothetical protein
MELQCPYFEASATVDNLTFLMLTCTGAFYDLDQLRKYTIIYIYNILLKGKIVPVLN